MTKKIINYHYTECGLSNVWIWCYQAVDDAGEKVMIIPRIGSLHKLIANEIVLSNGSLTGPELKFLRTEMGLTQTELGELVDRTRLTISRWERGKSAPDGAAETLIRILASSKLELGMVDPGEIISKRTPTKKPKPRIKIEATDSKGYRLAA